jgi:hypothetical protein
MLFMISEGVYQDQFKMKKNSSNKTTYQQPDRYFAACLFCRTIIMYKPQLLRACTHINMAVQARVIKRPRSLPRERSFCKGT